MVSPGWAWLCTANVVGAEQVAEASMIDHAKQALSGWLWLDHAINDSIEQQAFDGKVMQYTDWSFNISVRFTDQRAVPLYNAILLFAHAATRVIDAGGDPKNGLLLTQAMANASFQGA